MIEHAMVFFSFLKRSSLLFAWHAWDRSEALFGCVVVDYRLLLLGGAWSVIKVCPCVCGETLFEGAASSSRMACACRSRCSARDSPGRRFVLAI